MALDSKKGRRRRSSSRDGVANPARWGRRPSSNTFISCASLFILSSIHQVHADPMAQPLAPSLQTIERFLQSGGLTIGTAVDLETCYASLQASDVNGDGKLSPPEYLSFVQLMADGKLDTNEYGIPITEFYLLPQEFIGIYNLFACGNANYGCPSVVGIDIAGIEEGGEMTEQQEGFVFQLCKVSEAGVGSLPDGSPTGRPTAGAVATPPTIAPSTAATPLLPPCPPLFDEAATYAAGDRVSDGENSYYQCRPFPQSGWCDQTGYEPGNSLNWQEAWSRLGTCDPGAPAPPSPKPTSLPPGAPTLKPVFPTYSPTASGGGIPTLAPSSSPTSKETSAVPPATPPPTSPPTSKPVSGGDGDDLYSGPVETAFEYEIFNTKNLNAQSILLGTNPENDMLAVLLQSTFDFVDGVVDDTFGQSAEGGIDHSKGNRRKRRHQAPLGLRQKSRDLEVILAPNAVAIDDVEDVVCSDSSLATSNCQKVTAAASLVLMNEPKDDTMLQFQNAIARALEDPGVAFPEDSGIVYAGPASESNVAVIPGVTDPDTPEGESPPEDDGSGTPGWVVPVSIAAAAVGSIVLVLFVGSRVQKRKRTAKEYDGALDDDLAGGDGSASYDAEIQLGAPSKVSPLDAPDVENGKRARSGSDNPFLNYSSSSSGSSRSGSGSSSSVPSGSYSQSVSSESSSEDIAGGGGEPETKDDQYWKEREEYWERTEAQAVVQLRDNDPKNFWKAKEAEMKQKSQPQQPQDHSDLHTLHEVSEENLSKSGWSLMSDSSDKSDKSVYRAGVEALVKEACPERLGELDAMMVEYEGREEVLIGHLSTMLAAKNRGGSSSGASGASSSEDEDDRRQSALSEYTAGSNTSGYLSSSASEWTDSTGSARSSLNTSLGGDTIRGSLSTSMGQDDVSDEDNDTPGETPAAIASEAAATSLLSSSASAEDELDEEMDDSSSSSTGSTGWSSDDGLSSIETSSRASADTDGPQLGATSLDHTLATIGDAAAVSQRVTGYSGSEKPTFIPVDGPEEDMGDAGETTAASSGESNVATRKDLDDAINAGDWSAVGATAALIADSSPNRSKGTNDEDFNASDFNASNFSVSSHEQHQVEELESLVEAGNWEAVMAAASKYEGVSDSESNLMESRQSVLDDSESESEGIPPETTSLGGASQESLRAEIESLVKAVVPEELDNLDEMMIQFKGREDELITTLKTMSQETTASDDDGRGGDLLPGVSSHLADRDPDAVSVYEYQSTNASVDSALEDA